VGQKNRRDNLDMFSRLKVLWKKKSLEVSDTGIDQCIKKSLG
jgi:hypothetical protein